MSDELYAPGDSYTDVNGDAWSTTEFEPIFDAAEFMRFGRDIFTQRSSVSVDNLGSLNLIDPSVAKSGHVEA